MNMNMNLKKYDEVIQIIYSEETVQKKEPISNLNYNPNTLWSPEMLTHPESQNQGHLKSVNKN